MEFYGHIIDGHEVASVDGDTFEDIDPYTREVWATVALGGKEDADLAVASARRAFDDGPWPRMGFEKRQQVMHRLADLMEEHADELAMADTRDMGKPITQSRHDVARSVLNFRFFADHARMSTGDALPMDTGHHAYTRYDPAGVVAAISPWNFPLMLATWKVAPALAWGNTVVLKPAEDTPVSMTWWPAGDRGGLPAGRAQCGARLWARLRGRRADDEPRRRPHHLHGRIGYRQGDQRGRSAQPRPGEPRAGRQGREHRVRRCRARQRRALGGRVDLPQRRSGVPGRQSAVRPERHLRRVHPALHRGRRGTRHRRPEGSGDAVLRRARE